MKRNQILRFAHWMIIVVIAMMIISILATIIMIIHWHFDRTFYDQVYLENGFKAGIYTFNLKVSDKELTDISLGSLSSANMFWLIFRSLLLLVLHMYVLITLLKIINSFRDLRTFYIQSIQSFNVLAIIYLITSLIAFFNLEFAENDINWYFTIPFQQLLATSFCLVLREVFKEGLKLHEDSKSII